MRARRLAALALVAGLSAPAAAQGTPRFIVSLDGHSRPIALDTMGVRVVLPGAEPAAVWNALVATYADAKIPLTVRDSTGGALGTLAFITRRSLWRKPLSRFFDCGASVTGPNADNYRVTMAVVSWIVPGDGGPTVWTAVAAGGRDLSGTSNHSTTCQSLGELEGVLHDAMRARLGLGPRR